MLDKLKRKKPQETQIKSSDQQEKPGKKPESVKRDALLAADRNRWFYVCLGLVFLCFLLGLQAMKANQRFANNVQVAWVKMYPNGTWDIDFYDEERGPQFFQSTVDYMLKEWVQRRYSKMRVSIESDYGFALQFMAPKLARSFLDEEQYNAAAVVANFLEKVEQPELEIKVDAVDHYDSDITRFGRADGTLYRTNVFVTEKQKGSDGALLGDPVSRIVSLQWRIKSVEEISADKKLLKINPIGLEIINSGIVDDQGHN
jgi:hypothetical protein